VYSFIFQYRSFILSSKLVASGKVNTGLFAFSIFKNPSKHSDLKHIIHFILFPNLCDVWKGNATWFSASPVSRSNAVLSLFSTVFIIQMKLENPSKAFGHGKRSCNYIFLSWDPSTDGSHGATIGKDLVFSSWKAMSFSRYPGFRG
jgi:hypothetical protein